MLAAVVIVAGIVANFGVSGLMMCTLMAGVMLIVLRPYRVFRTSPDRARVTAALDSIRRMIGFNLLLGLLTVAIAVLA